METNTKFETALEELITLLEKQNSNLDLKKIENEEETFKHKSVSLSMSKKIAQKRCSMKLTQKDLAFKLSLPEKIIKDYENGSAIPNHIIINKIEKIIGKIRD